MKRWTTGALLAGSLGLGGCGTSGELGQGSFFYECADLSDETCSAGNFGSDEIPAPVGRFGRFKVTFRGGNTGTATVEPASPVVGFNSEGTVTLTADGAVALLARSGGRVIDFVHVEVRSVDTLRLLGGQAPGANNQVSVQAGSNVDVLIAPVDETGTTVAGSYDYMWETADGNVADVTGETDDNSAVVHGLTAGSTTLTVSASGVSQVFAVEVSP